MNHEILAYVVATFLGGILSLILCIYAYLHIKKAPGGKYYILATASASFFTFSYAFELLSTTLEGIKFWIKIEYLTLPLIPVFILFMCLDYVGKKVSRTWAALLYGVSIFTTMMVLTDDFHHFYYSSVSLVSDSPHPIANTVGGPWFMVHTAKLYFLVATSVVVLIRQLTSVSGKFRKQILLLITGMLIPVIASFFYRTDLSPNGIDIGPVSMCLSFIFHGIALFSFKMFNVAPIARVRVFESISDGVIVINNQNVLADYNQAMTRILPVNQDSIGRTITEILENNYELAEIIANEVETDYQIAFNGESRFYQIRFTSVFNKKNISIGKIISFTDVTKRVVLEEKLTQLASLDGLTQIYNRATFMKLGGYELHSNSDVSLIMFDIDHFKKVNDTYGHTSGDTVLCKVVEIARDMVGEAAFLGRFGGEEFLICMPNATLEDATIMAENIRQVISTTCIEEDGHPIMVTSSFGVTHSSFMIGKPTFNILLSQADQALYSAKEKGRNCVVSYQELNSSSLVSTTT